MEASEALWLTNHNLDKGLKDVFVAIRKEAEAGYFKLDFTELTRLQAIRLIKLGYSVANEFNNVYTITWKE